MNKKSFSGRVFTSLNHKLMKLDHIKHDEKLLTRDSFFTRKDRKLSFIEDMKILMSIGSSSMKKELFRYFNYDINTVSLPGFIKSRAKIKDEAFKELMKMMNKAYPCNKTYKGYRLLAVDGSELPISVDENDTDTHVVDSSRKGHNSYHLNALYDVLCHRYIDCIIQPIKEKHENCAMWTMAERYDGGKAVFMADRFYGTFNNLEHLRHTGHRYLVRIKDLDSKNWPFRNIRTLPSEGEFDEDVSLILTKKTGKKYRSNPDKYKILVNNSPLDYIDKENPFYEASYRVVRFYIGGKQDYETIITNLDREQFPAQEIKKLYNLRWDIEVSYRHLKYSVDLNALHSKRRDFIRQEVWARMIMFNISMIIVEYIRSKKLEKKARRWEYEVNITMAIFFAKQYMVKRKDGDPPDLENLIASQILPVRPDRHYSRNVKSQPYVSFGYRFS